jgi:hypothetical protein
VQMSALCSAPPVSRGADQADDERQARSSRGRQRHTAGTVYLPMSGSPRARFSETAELPTIFQANLCHDLQRSPSGQVLVLLSQSFGTAPPLRTGAAPVVVAKQLALITTPLQQRLHSLSACFNRKTPYRRDVAPCTVDLWQEFAVLSSDFDTLTLQQPPEGKHSNGRSIGVSESFEVILEIIER